MVTKENVIKIAKLSKLEIHSDELEKFTHQMNHILDFIKKLDQLDTSKIEPTSHAVSMETALREDRVIENNIRDKVFKISPDHEGNLFKVPKVL